MSMLVQKREKSITDGGRHCARTAHGGHSFGDLCIYFLIPRERVVSGRLEIFIRPHGENSKLVSSFDQLEARTGPSSRPAPLVVVEAMIRN